MLACSVSAVLLVAAPTPAKAFDAGIQIVFDGVEVAVVNIGNFDPLVGSETRRV